MNNSVIKFPRKKRSRKYKNGLGKSGKYWWVCINKNGKKIERSTGCVDRSDAEIVRDSLIRQLTFAKHDLKIRGPFDVPSLEKTAMEWAKANEGVYAPRYIDQMVKTVQVHMSPYKHLPLDEITTEIMEKARKKYLTSKGEKVLKGVNLKVEHSLGGANRLIRLISALFGWAIKRRQYIEKRPWNLSEVKVQQLPRPVVWPEQVRPFLEGVNKTTRSRVISLSIRMQLALGLRESETSSADWSWVSWRTSHYIPGKTKNRKLRQIPIPHWLLQGLREEWERQGKPTRGIILKHGAGEDPIYRGFTKNAIRVAGATLGIEGLHPHRLRATFATAHFEAGTTLQQIMLMLGHDKPQTTLRYIETRQKDVVQAQDKVAEAMGFSGNPSPMTKNEL